MTHLGAPLYPTLSPASWSLQQHFVCSEVHVQIAFEVMSDHTVGPQSDHQITPPTVVLFYIEQMDPNDGIHETTHYKAV